MPPLTEPPLRVLAPIPRTPRSSTTASTPCRDNSRAVVSPAYPAPTTTTLASCGTAASSPLAGRYASHQYGSATNSEWRKSARAIRCSPTAACLILPANRAGCYREGQPWAGALLLDAEALEAPVEARQLTTGIEQTLLTAGPCGMRFWVD